MSSQKHTGSCLCGAVSYETTGPLRPVSLCHCIQCRKTTGHFLAATSVSHGNFQLTRQDGLKWYVSSPTAKRGFCSQCGSTLFWQSNKRNEISIAAGTLDGATGLAVGRHIFCKFKGDYYSIAADEKQLDTW